MAKPNIEDKNFWAHVQLNWPQRRNALNREILEVLKDFFKTPPKASWRFVVLDGSGGFFCAGADIQEMKESILWDYDQNLAHAQLLHDFYENLWNYPLPVVAIVWGGAFGGGLGALGCADYVVAHPQAQFRFSEVALGVLPSVISDFLLRKWPSGLTLALMISGRPFSAPEAFSWGLVHELAQNTDPDLERQRVVDYFKTLSPQSLIHTKKLHRWLFHHNVNFERKSYCIHQLAQIRTTPQAQEGLKAFLEKRPPSWAQES